MTTLDRRLAAIVAADIVGYSRLMGRDEAGTLSRVKSLVTELLKPKIDAYRGRLVKTTGDGFLAEFSSVVDAFRCAEDVQDGIEARNAGLDEADRLEARIGINVGEIIFDDGDVFGDGVNIAARLEALAEPGGICVSARAWEDLRKLQIDFTDLGEQKLKNITQPVQAFSLSRLNRIGRPKSVLSKIRNNKGIAYATAALVVLLAVISGIYIFVAQSSDPALTFVTSSVDQMPCSWLRVAERSNVDGKNVFKITGASLTPPAAVSENILRAAVKQGLSIDKIEASELTGLSPRQCAWVETLKPLRYRGIPRISVDVSRGQGRQSQYSLNTFLVDFRDLKKVVQIYVDDGGGEIVPLISSEEVQRMGSNRAVVKLPDGRYKITVENDTAGMSGIIFAESDRPIPKALISKAISSPADVKDFNAAAEAGHWRFELLWFRGNARP
jgi:class 3 adenylate cyclase